MERNQMADYLLRMGWVVDTELGKASIYHFPGSVHRLLIPHVGAQKEAYYVDYAVRLMSRWFKRTEQEIRDDVNA